jgi:hypothetical protein
VATISTRTYLAEKFGLDIAYDPRRLNRPELLAPDTNPTVEGPWKVYRMPRKPVKYV